LGWVGLDQHDDDDEQPGRALTAALPLPLVLVLGSCSARACALVRERVPVAERVRSCLLNLRCPESRSSQLAALISHLGALISHLTLPQVSCQISRRRRRRGPVRGMQQRDLLLHHGCPRAPLPHRLPSGRVLWAPQGKTQVPGELFDQRDADADACPGGGLAAIRRNRAAFGFGRLPAVCL
jgi:hypothetical protein